MTTENSVKTVELSRRQCRAKVCESERRVTTIM
nr:MAG TPA: hypothetical protein [Bacteriophage sp.]